MVAGPGAVFATFAMRLEDHSRPTYHTSNLGATWGPGLSRKASKPLECALAVIWGHFAAVCNALGSFCGVLLRFGVVLRRPAPLWGRSAAFCAALGSFCGVLRRFGVVLRRSAAIWGRSAAFCCDLGSFCGLPQRCGALLRSFATMWCSFSGA